MASDPDAEATQAFPNPPSILYSQYTDENIESGDAPEPPVPVKGSYQMFGAPFNTEDSMIRPLEDQGIHKLYPPEYDKKAELKKLNRSLLICFLELLDILINNPSSPEREQKIKDLSVLFINMHHLINEYRPHQARETLKVIMERQKKQRDEMIQHIQRAMEKTQNILKSCDTLLSVTVSNISTTPVTPSATHTDDNKMEEEIGDDKIIMEDDNMASEVDQSNKSQEHKPFTLVDPQDLQLTKLVQSLISNSR